MNAPLKFVPESPMESREKVYATLEKAAARGELSLLLAKLLSSLFCGIGAMPKHFGMEQKYFSSLFTKHFPGVAVAPFFDIGQPLDIERAPEVDDLKQLFMEHAVDTGEQAQMMTTVLVAGCMGNDHLWQDMGFWSRKDLSRFIEIGFPALAAKNDKDMKWKKFFYKQLCIGEGVYICRAPSCAVCADYSVCFGPEE